MTEENLFMQSGLLQSMLLHGFLSQKKGKKRKKKRKYKRKKKKVTLGWNDIPGPGTACFLSRSRSSMYYIMLILHNRIKPLNVISTNGFS